MVNAELSGIEPIIHSFFCFIDCAGERYFYSHAKTGEFWIVSTNNDFLQRLLFLFLLTHDWAPDPDYQA